MSIEQVIFNTFQTGLVVTSSFPFGTSNSLNLRNLDLKSYDIFRYVVSLDLCFETHSLTCEATKYLYAFLEQSICITQAFLSYSLSFSDPFFTKSLTFPSSYCVSMDVFVLVYHRMKNTYQKAERMLQGKIYNSIDPEVWYH